MKLYTAVGLLALLLIGNTQDVFVPEAEPEAAGVVAVETEPSETPQEEVAQ
jgi:hypothetical protein